MAGPTETGQQPPEEPGRLRPRCGDVHKLGSKIVVMGWSSQATAHAVCVEDTDGAAAAFTGRLAAGSDGLLAANRAEVKSFPLCDSTADDLRDCSLVDPFAN